MLAPKHGRAEPRRWGTMTHGDHREAAGAPEVMRTMMSRRSFSVFRVLAAAGLLVSLPARAADPTTADCIGASDASIKANNEHKLRAARSQLLVCAAASCPADIRRECVGRVDALNAAIPTIIFQTKDGAGADIIAVKVTMDGEVIAERLEGTALSIDPGSHTFTFETAGQPATTQRLVIQQGEKDRRERVVFGPTASPVAAPGPTPSNAPGALPSTPDLGASSSSSGLGTQKILALVAGGVGVVGLGIGAVFGAIALSQKSAAQSACPGSQCTTQDGVNKWSDAASTGIVSTIGLIVGGVGIAGAAVLWFTAPSGGSSTQVGLGPGVLQVKATW
jgi:hypothetical protein